MAEGKDAFYIVQKGDIAGVYKSLSDCQAFIGSSASNSSLRVFKGYGLAKETEDYLSSRGLSNAAYSINVANVRNDLFGGLVVCPFQDIIGSTSRASIPINKQANYNNYPETKDIIGSTSRATIPINKQANYSYAEAKEVIQSTSISINLPNHHMNYEPYLAERIAPGSPSCILEFDGASKGNPGPAGAGAILRSGDGSAIFELREGVGTATNNVAEYRAAILGLKQALKKGFKHIRVQGDSNLVCMQIQGLWKIKSQNLVDLCKEAQELKNKFTSFQISHIPREQNSAADAQANRAINLRDGQVEENVILF